MARASTNSLSPPKKESRQFSITSFLPKASGSTFTPTPPLANSSSSKKRKRKVESSEEELEVSDQEDQEPVPVKRDVKGKGKPKVIDLTLDEEDDIIMPPPSVPLKKVPKVEKQDKGKGKAIDPSTNRVEEMWVDKFAPTSREELSIHKKKIQDVEGWLLESLSTENPKLRKYRRLLVMSGPSGAGKTACLKMLCEEMGVEILEWKEESRVVNAGDEYGESMVNRFTSFLSRAGMAPSLDFVDSSPSPASSSSTPSSSSSLSTPSSNPRRLILLEDLPNISHYPTKLALRSALSQFLTSPRVTCPLVLIVSEALTRPGSEGVSEMIGGIVGGGREESLDSRGVCGVEVLQHPACREISFNPIAVTIMKKSLSRILDQIYVLSSSSTSRRSTSSLLLPKSSRPSTSTLEAIIKHSQGDIRSALMSLQFLSTQSSNDLTSSLTTGKGGVKGKKKKGKGDEGELLSIVTSRENSLFIFHALGKVLYNKRWGDSEVDDKKDFGRPGIVQPPSSSYEEGTRLNKLPKHVRAEWGEKGLSKVDPDVLFAEAPIDSDVFLTYLHHNYPQFTNSSIESCSLILDGLSTSDSLLRLESDSETQRRTPLTSLYSFAVGVRTTLAGLPSPVERNKQVLRKSEWWECEKVRKINLEGVGEMIARGKGLGGGGGSEEGEGYLRDRKSLMTEMIPWLGVIKPPHANPFLLDLAQFPPLSSATSSSITGEALGEKDINADDEEGGEEDEKPDLSVSGDVGGKPVKLEELEEEEELQEEVTRKKVEEKGWFEEEDDIVDVDDD